MAKITHFKLLVGRLALKLNKEPADIEAIIDKEANRSGQQPLGVAMVMCEENKIDPSPPPQDTKTDPAPAEPEIITDIVEADAPAGLVDIDIQGTKHMREAFDQMKKDVLRKGDIQVIKTTKGTRSFIKKSGTRILAAAFNISDDIVSKERIHDPATGLTTWVFVAKAYAPNGRCATAIASCSSNEKSGMREHDIMATAHTRAKSRAILDLIGAGEVSAEEVLDG